MLKALWFAVKVGLLIAVAVWVAERPGTVRIEWMDYVATIHMGFFLLLALLAILLSIFIYRVMTAIVGLPASYRRYLEIKGREKGYRALTLGLAAVAAGDTKIAVRQAGKAMKLMPDDEGLPRLLSAQAARLDGREEDAAREFLGLLESKDASFLGVRGLLQTALDQGDYESARKLVDKALALHPKQVWILNIARDVYVRVQDFEAARDVTQRIFKAKGMEASQAAQERAALFLAEGQQDFEAERTERAHKMLKQAHKVKGDFAPVVLALSSYYSEQGRAKEARKVIEKAFKAAPHEAYVSFWAGLYNGEDVLGRLKHMARLVKINSSLALAHREAGAAALEAGLWGEAREYFEAAEKIEPSAALYRLWARLEEQSVHDEQASRSWLEKAVNAPSEKGWVCGETGRVYERWAAVVPPHGGFNTLEWREPSKIEYNGILGGPVSEFEESLIEAPAA